MTKQTDPDAVMSAAAAVGIEIAVLDRFGVIESVNSAWDQFSKDNGGDPARTGVGVSYLDVCDLAGDDPGAREVASAIRRALTGDLTAAEVVEIPCHSTSQNRWFDVLISARAGDGAGATVVLTPATTRSDAASPPTGFGLDLRSPHQVKTSQPLSDLPAAEGAVAWAMVEASPDALVMADEHGVIELVNSQAENLFGYNRVEMLGRPVEMLLPDSLAKVHSAHRTRFRVAPEVRLMGTGQDLRARRADGSEVPVEVSLSPMRVRGALRVIAAVRDISERVAAQGEANRIRKGFDSIPDGVYMFTLDTLHFRYVNEGAVQQSGYSKGELLAKMTPLHMAPEFNRRQFDAMLAPLSGGMVPSIQLETTMRRSSGEDFPVEVILDCPADDDDPARVVVAVVRDITDRVEAARSAFIVEHSVNSVSDAVFVCDEHSLEFLHVNQGTVDLHGFTREELLTGMTPADLAPGISSDQLGALLEHLSNRPGEYGELSAQGVCKNGDVLDVEVRINWPEPSSPNAPRPVVAVVRDVTARIEAEQQALETATRFRAAFGDGPVPMSIVEVSPTADRVIVEANQAMADLLGSTIEGLVGRSVIDFLHPDEVEADNAATIGQVAGDQQAFTSRKRYLRADGETVWVQVYVRVLEREGDRILTIGTSIDVSAEVRAEQALARTSKLNQTLSQLRLHMLQGTSRTEALALVCEGIQDTLGADAVLVLTPTSIEEELAIEASVGLKEDVRAGLSFRTDRGVSGHVFRTGEAQLVALDDDRISSGNRDAALRAGAGSMLVTPLHGATETFGLLLLARAAGSADFDIADLETVARFAAAAVSAIELAAGRITANRLELLEDRERIGRDMHDKVISRLFATGMALQATTTRVQDSDSRARLGSAIADIDETITEIRNTIYGLRSQVDWGKGRRGEILAIAAGQKDTLGFEPRVKFSGSIDQVPRTVVDQLVATLREALANTAKYAHARSVTIDITADQQRLRLSVTDDGVGFTKTKRSSGLTGNGLINMIARAKDLGGDASITSETGAGTTIEWTVPF